MKYSVKYSGPLVSNNKFYAGVHWQVRNKIKNDYSLIFKKLLRDQKIPKFDSFTLRLVFNSRHDIDNVVATAKIFIDCLKGEWVADDTKKHFNRLVIEHGPELETNTAIFELDTQ